MGNINPSNGPYQNAKGDIVAGNGSGSQPVVISVGTDGQVLTASSSSTGGVKWGAAGGGGSFVLISTQTASSSASIIFNSGLTYNCYYIVLTEVSTSIDQNDLCMQVSSNGGSTWQTTGYVPWNVFDVNPVTQAAANVNQLGGLRNGNSTFFSIVAQVSNVASGGVSGTLNLFNCNNTRCFLTGQTTSYINPSGSPYWTTVRTGGHSPDVTVNALKFFFGAGNIASGSISLYGITA